MCGKEGDKEAMAMGEGICICLLVADRLSTIRGGTWLVATFAFVSYFPPNFAKTSKQNPFAGMEWADAVKGWMGDDLQTWETTRLLVVLLSKFLGFSRGCSRGGW